MKRNNSIDHSGKKRMGGDDFFKAIIDGMQCGFISVDNKGRIVKINEIAKRILGLDAQPGKAGIPEMNANQNKKPIVKLDVKSGIRRISGPDAKPDAIAALKQGEKRTSGMSASEADIFEGRHISQVLKPFPYLTKIMLESCHMSTLPNRDETEIQLEGKEKKKIGFTISLVKDPQGEDIGCSMFFKDLTKIEEREEQENLKERLAALGHMSASLAHELRNPLAAIGVNASFLRRMLKEDAEAMAILDGIISDIARLNATISDSLSFVKPLDVNLAPARIEELIEQAISSALTKDDLMRIKIKKNYRDPLGPMLLDPDLLTKAFINILKNASEAMEGKGTIEIGLSRTMSGPESAWIEAASKEEEGSGDGEPGVRGEEEVREGRGWKRGKGAKEGKEGKEGRDGGEGRGVKGEREKVGRRGGASRARATEREHLHGRPGSVKDQEYVIIRIKNTGKGIPSDVIDKIFYPFFTTKEKGSGLGLSFTKKAVDAHKGFLDVESQVGLGTAFTIRLPLMTQR